MYYWSKHNDLTWIIKDENYKIVALVTGDPITELYNAQLHSKNLGLYANLTAAKDAATPTDFVEHLPQTKITKTKQDTPWDN